jgi:hypothetical protein
LINSKRELFYGLHVCGLGALRALSGFKRHLLTFSEGFETIVLNLRKMHKQIVPALLLDKAEAFLIGEPFDCSFWQVRSSSHQLG